MNLAISLEPSPVGHLFPYKERGALVEGERPDSGHPDFRLLRHIIRQGSEQRGDLMGRISDGPFIHHQKVFHSHLVRGRIHQSFEGQDCGDPFRGPLSPDVRDEEKEDVIRSQDPQRRDDGHPFGGGSGLVAQLTDGEWEEVVRDDLGIWTADRPMTDANVVEQFSCHEQSAHPHRLGESRLDEILFKRRKR